MPRKQKNCLLLQLTERAAVTNTHWVIQLQFKRTMRSLFLLLFFFTLLLLSMSDKCCQNGELSCVLSLTPLRIVSWFVLIYTFFIVNSSGPMTIQKMHDYPMRIKHFLSDCIKPLPTHPLITYIYIFQWTLFLAHSSTSKRLRRLGQQIR